MPTHSSPVTSVLRRRILSEDFIAPSMVHLPACYYPDSTIPDSLSAHSLTLSPSQRFQCVLKLCIHTSTQDLGSQKFLLKISYYVNRCKGCNRLIVLRTAPPPAAPVPLPCGDDRALPCGRVAPVGGEGQMLASGEGAVQRTPFLSSLFAFRFLRFFLARRRRLFTFHFSLFTFFVSSLPAAGASSLFALRSSLFAFSSP